MSSFCDVDYPSYMVNVWDHIMCNVVVKAGLDSIPVRTRLEDLEKSSGLSGTKSMEMSTNPMQKDNSSFIQSQQKQTQQLVQQQDASIDTLAGAVDRLHVIGTQIQEEVKEQADLLEKTDQEMDYASEKMAGVQGQLARLLQSKDSCQIWTIVFLTFTLVILSKWLPLSIIIDIFLSFLLLSMYNYVLTYILMTHYM